jgi:hypothetical protein
MFVNKQEGKTIHYWLFANWLLRKYNKTDVQKKCRFVMPNPQLSSIMVGHYSSKSVK